METFSESWYCSRHAGVDGLKEKYTGLDYSKELWNSMVIWDYYMELLGYASIHYPEYYYSETKNKISKRMKRLLKMWRIYRVRNRLSWP